MKISPSILGIQIENLETELESLSLSDTVHLDIMDGKYVERMTRGVADFSRINFANGLEIHLMVENVETFLSQSVTLRPQTIFIHCEQRDNQAAQKCFEKIREKNIQTGLVIDLTTDIQNVQKNLILSSDKILIMSIKAGKLEQKFNAGALEKIKYLRGLKFTGEIIVDGGVDSENVAQVAAAGADRVVMGRGLLGLSDTDRPKLITKVHKL